MNHVFHIVYRTCAASYALNDLSLILINHGRAQCIEHIYVLNILVYPIGLFSSFSVSVFLCFLFSVHDDSVHRQCVEQRMPAVDALNCMMILILI
jgi:hypothetical protein